jgi:ATP-dependent Clp protease protease subunit
MTKKVKVLLRVKDAKGNVRCEVKQNADTGVLRVLGEIDWWNNNAEGFRNALDSMKQNGITKLKAYINSPGGSVWEANEIYNLIVGFCTEENRTLELGAMCASAATTIAGAFPQKNTKAYKNITWMMHNTQVAVYGEQKDLLSYAQLLGNLDAAYRKRWSQRMGISETVLKNKMDSTWWLTADELKQYNIIAGFIDQDDTVPADARNVFNKLQIKELPAVLNKALPPAEDNPEPIKNAMKNFVLLLMASLASIKNYLKEDATDAEVVAALTKAFSEKENKITELTNSVTAKDAEIKKLEAQVKQHNTDMIKALLDVAQNTEKKITAEMRKVYEEQAPVLGFEGLSKIINAIPARTNIKNAIETHIPGNSGKKEKENEEREEPEFVRDENGGRVYDKPSNQREVLQRVLANQKATK